jgi:hypothetical protein
MSELLMLISHQNDGNNVSNQCKSGKGFNQNTRALGAGVLAHPAVALRAMAGRNLLALLFFMIAMFIPGAYHYAIDQVNLIST